MEKIKYSNHNHGIDLLRGLAILFVILLHINTRIPFSDTFLGSLMPASAYKIIFWSGYYGVCTDNAIADCLVADPLFSSHIRSDGLCTKCGSDKPCQGNICCAHISYKLDRN